MREPSPFVVSNPLIDSRNHQNSYLAGSKDYAGNFRFIIQKNECIHLGCHLYYVYISV